MSANTKPIRICLFAPEAYPFFSGGQAFSFPEREFRVWLLARGLSGARSLDVSVVLKGSRKGIKTVGGVVVHSLDFYLPCFGEAAGTLKWIVRRFIAKFFPRFEKDRWEREVKNACDDIAADVYCTFVIDDSTRLIADYCRQKNCRYIVFLPSQATFPAQCSEHSMSLLPSGTQSDVGFRLLKEASAVVVPYGFDVQKNGGDGSFAVYPCSVPVDTADNMKQVPRSAGRHVLWMGEASDTSRPLEYLDLARAFPEVQFKMLACETHDELNQTVRDSAPRNLEITTVATMNEIETLFRNAAVFVNTASADGFVDGVYLAAKWGVPILSLESDPDGFIGEGGGGVLLDGDREKLSSALEQMLGSIEDWDAMSQALRDRVVKHNNPAAVGERLMRLLEDRSK